MNDLPPSSREERKTLTLLDILEKADLDYWTKQSRCLSSSPEDGNRSNFRNFVFSSYLRFREMDKGHKPSNSECYTPSSEPLRFYSHRVMLRKPEGISPLRRSSNRWRDNIKIDVQEIEREDVDWMGTTSGLL
jgi:hypothetical protein